MATKNIKKILLNKNGNKFVVDTENIVRSVNGVGADENGNVSITFEANHAITADSATNANHANSADVATSSEIASKLAKSVNIGLSGAVQGSASFNGANDITIKTTSDLESTIMNNMVGDAKEGQVLSTIFDTTKNQNVVTSYPLIDFCKIVTTVETLNQLKLVPVGMKLIFDKWYRFTHGNNDNRTSDQNLNDGNGPHNTTRNAWSYVPSTSSIRSNINSSVYSCFVSDRKYDNWYLKMRATGDDEDNDLFSILLGFMTDANGREHTLSAVRTLCVENHTKYLWSIVYDYMQDLEFELVSNSCSQIVSLPGGWLNRYAIIEARRTKTNLKCYTSAVSTSTNIESLPDSKLEYTLPLTKPSNYSQAMYDNIKTMLSNPSQIGVGCHSQPGNFTILEQKYIFNDEKIYDMINDVIWEYSEKTNNWNNVGKCSASLREGQIYYNESTKQTFYYTNGNAYCIGNVN